MITKEQALTANEFHVEGQCTRHKGPRGGIREHSVVWRRNGKTQTWVTQPDDYRVPIKHGLKSYDSITPPYANRVHAAEDCPLNDPNYITK